ncbi:hypothetical protein [Pedobacter sp. SYSU D00535]|uniref:hypothetical protein n=1 Tax=Pedobacter sp. SYSU D00535 TaxID=2810308 RepID=UPI001A958AE6|nr:hypothetical protein [Pedobacter sp. SYSU D00535]
MVFSIPTRRKIALSLIGIFILDIATPALTYALTSGPTQPETQAFQPASVSDMVDLSTGDFKYNIPLLDVDGYPVNLNYQSGIGMDDEASWVGLGWNLNIGAINRQMRGIPDDSFGDPIISETSMKDKITIGGRGNVKVELKGKDKKVKLPRKLAKKFKMTVSGTVNVGIFNDNYTGIGAEVGVNPGISVSSLNDGLLTAGMGLGVVSNTVSGAGVDVSPYINMSWQNKRSWDLSVSAGASYNLGYNSRSGMKDITLGKSFSGSFTGKNVGAAASLDASTSLVSYNTEPVSPTIQVPFETTHHSFSLDAGGAELIIFAGGGIAGYRTVRKVKDYKTEKKGYGFLYSDKAKGRNDAVMDFIREKDNPYIPGTPNIAMPVQLPDLFTYTSQTGSGQFRLYRSTGAFGDPEVQDKSETYTGGADLGIGASSVHLGLKYFDQKTTNFSRKWEDGNNYLSKGDFQVYKSAEPQKEHVYFRVVGEKSVEGPNLNNFFKNNSPVAVPTSARTTGANFRKADGSIEATGNIENSERQGKRTVISYLTAKEAMKAALDPAIKFYRLNDPATFAVPEDHNSELLLEQILPRAKDYRKDDHISEISVNDDGGGRTIYGIPVYNVVQQELSFAVGNEGKNDYIVQNKNQVQFTIDGDKPFHKKGIDEYFQRQTSPAYASSYLLTAILSPDYIDRGEKGISAEDAGTAIKFNYSKLNGLYKWRTPYATNTATLSKGLLADADDDKASIVYGEKEITYLHSIETKTKIAYFITSERLDGLGVQNWLGGKNQDFRQRRLTEIILYSKADVSKPIKRVKFEYNYDLCPGTPNSIDANGGKLTLKRVWFEYGNTSKGKNHPYTFSYKMKISGIQPQYENMTADRWGTYKPDNQNPVLPGFPAPQNDVFPYSNQNQSEADENAGLWNLEQVGLPTGGTINVSYESDDYAYVQNKDAMRMQHFEYLVGHDGNPISSSDPEALSKAKGLRVKLSKLPEDAPPGTDVTPWFKKTYLNGSDYLYTKFYVKMSTAFCESYGKDFDFVPCYAKVRSVNIYGSEVNVFFDEIDEKGVKDKNPICIAGWQKLKNDYPKYANKGFSNRAQDGDAQSNIKRAIKALGSSITNLGELTESFYRKANRRKFATSYQHALSFVRLTETDGIKLGGGVRVKQVQIRDNWQEMSTSAAVDRTYGQKYTYRTKRDGQEISSGVAAYEPNIGGDENPLREPVPYVQDIKGAISNYFNLEEPFGESFYPAPLVVYSKVKVEDLGATERTPATGYIMNEFYTAKDFPVRVGMLKLVTDPYRPSKLYKVLASTNIEELALSQGYSVELNDMHGKPKATRIFNQANAEISSIVYNYFTEPTGPEEWRLKNGVQVVNQDGSVVERTIGRDVEFFTDMREQLSSNSGKSINLGLDFPRIFPIPHWPKLNNSDYKLFRSTSAVKVVQYYGVLKEVIKTENGSSISTENIAFDGLTGEALVTKTQNEFNDDIYSVNLPAYWIYKGMGAAYQNLGMYIENLDGLTISNSPYNQLLNPGDEIISIRTGTSYWVVETNGVKRLIKKDGSIYKGSIATAKLVRSSFRNLLQATTGSLVCLTNPITNGHFAFALNAGFEDLKVINASVQTYDDKWVVEDIDEKVPVLNSLGLCSDIPGSDGLMDHRHNSITRTDGKLPSKFWIDRQQGGGGAYGRCGIKLCETKFGETVEAVEAGLESSFEISTEGDYVFAFTGNTNRSKWRITNCTDPTFQEISDVSSDQCSLNHMLLYVYHLKPGRYIIDYSFGAYRRASVSNPYIFPDRTGGFEIYTNTFSELIHTDDAGSGVNIINSSRMLIGTGKYRAYQKVKHFGSDEVEKSYLHGNVIDYCDIDAQRGDPFINPYYRGYLGNWYPFEKYVFQTQREYNNIFRTDKKGLDTRNSGYFSSYNPFWRYSNSGWVRNGAGQGWLAASAVSLYDRYGQELENRDALGRYSAAIFDFNGELPAAVASNAMNREVYVEGFEDNNFRKENGLGKGITEFRQESGEEIFKSAVNTRAHSGNYSLVIPASGMILSSFTHGNTHKGHSGQYFEIAATNEYQLLKGKGIYPNGFEPKPSTAYIINAWVKDGHPENKNLDLTYSVNGQLLNFRCKTVVEGWKLIEGTFTSPPTNTNFNLQIVASPGAEVFIDDIRIHPSNSHVKSYAYDEKNFKLMAELDENGFATFYEYDDEGSLARVKKETERGIVTIKESRSSYKKRAL